MVNIIKQEINIDESIKKKIDFICSFTNTTPKYFNGNLRQIEKTNLIYYEPHRVIIKGKTYLFFNSNEEIYIENLNNKILIKDLENYIKMPEIATK
ncbi:MAG: hypothetical protein PHG03_05140 [Bacilli bacterium]|nr:hypothetical protein [Bacilli bacterium]MDD4795919.1 hypothetical protein [Bacilli bacterium]